MKTIRENLLTLRAVIEAAPLKNFDLNVTHEERQECGSVFCVFGWAAASRQFDGLKWTPGAGTAFGSVRFNGKLVDYDRWYHSLDVLFGEHSHANLFQYAGNGELDEGLGYPAREYVDSYMPEEQKALALARIDKQLESYP